jgi:hypothetical protein
MENSMEKIHGKFHGISWNSMEYFMEFHGGISRKKSVKCL